MAKQSVMFSKCVRYNYDPTEVGLMQVIDIRTEYHKIVIISFPLPPLLNLSAFHKKFSPYIQTKTTNMSFQMRSILPPMSQPAFLSLRKSKQCRFLIAHKRAQKRDYLFSIILSKHADAKHATGVAVRILTEGKGQLQRSFASENLLFPVSKTFQRDLNLNFPAIIFKENIEKIFYF